MANLFDTHNNQPTEEYNPRPVNQPIKSNSSQASRIAFYVLATIPLGIGWIFYIKIRNNFRVLENKINQNASTIDVQLEKRYATLVNLKNQVSKYYQFEKETLMGIAQLRSLIGSKDPNKIGEIDQLNSNIFGRLFAVAENYPELQASKLFQELMAQNVYLEREIAAARRSYNQSVTEFNTDMTTWPKNVAAYSLGLQSKQLYAVSEQRMQPVTMEDL